MLVEGPVEVLLEDGSVVTSDRFLVALCVCRRSRRFPFCDTSHRRRTGRGTETPSTPRASADPPPPSDRPGPAPAARRTFPPTPRA
ncbi:CDGSH iron-sulfur domain-containing protein [Nonomuraea angiospora]|uniref:CDGSH iron-sulfur domain-containing protein n=1 Tax=Nonomuraea angiospora TaxID=46172 RepID=UPI0036C966E5